MTTGQPASVSPSSPDVFDEGLVEGMSVPAGSGGPKGPSSQAGSGSKSSYYKATPPCHEGNVLVQRVKRPDGTEFSIFAGGESRKGGWEVFLEPPDLVIGPMQVVDHNYGPPPSWRASRHFPVFCLLDWPDFDIPNMTKPFWDDLVLDILEKPEVAKIQVQCQGGHGRTGTALAILLQLILRQWKSVDELVAATRVKYCNHAVEADRQMEYIATVTGLPWQGIVKPYKETYTKTPWVSPWKGYFDDGEDDKPGSTSASDSAWEFDLGGGLKITWKDLVEELAAKGIDAEKSKVEAGSVVLYQSKNGVSEYKGRLTFEEACTFVGLL